MFCTAYRLQGNLRVVPLSIVLKAERDGASVRTPHPFLPVFENMVHNLTGGGNMLYFFSIKSRSPSCSEQLERSTFRFVAGRRHTVYVFEFIGKIIGGIITDRLCDL